MRRATAALLVAMLALAVAGPAGARTGQTRISGQLVSSGQSLTGLRIIALPTQGLAAIATVKRDGSFRLSVPTRLVGGMSFQLVAATGGYGGPVLLRTVRVGGAKRGALRLAASSRRAIRLGVIRLVYPSRSAGASTFARLVRSLPAARVLGSAAKTVRLKAGRPVGAGRIGLVASARARSLRAGGCGADPTEVGAGGDCDQDGVPNAVDVDDNGNRSLDGVDRQSAATTATINPFTSLRPSLVNTQNVYEGATPTTINDFLGDGGAGGTLSITFFLDQAYLDPYGKTPLDEVWATCPYQMTWCAPGTATAGITGMSEFPALLPGMDPYTFTDWSGYHGSACRQGQPCTAKDGHANAFTEYLRDGATMPTWVAGLRPRARDTLGSVRPGDIIAVNTRRGTSVSSLPVSITPYFVTSPAIAEYATGGATTRITYPVVDGDPGTNESAPIDLGADGRLTLTVLRPQRFALPGETAQFYDVTGLHWGFGVDTVVRGGVPINPDRQHGCTLTGLDNLTAQAYNPGDAGDPFNELAPVRDARSVDYATNAADATPPAVTFTVDVDACARAEGITPQAGDVGRVMLQAIGEQVSGGANGTGVAFLVRFNP